MTPYKKILLLHNKVFEPFNYYTKKAGFSVNIGRLALASALGELSSEHVVFNIQLSLL